MGKIKNMFVEHPNENGKTWGQHAKFAVGIACKMMNSSCFFLLHGLMPFIPIPTFYNLESMSAYLLEKNNATSAEED